MDYGDNMPNKKKFDKSKWDMIIGKLMKLGTAIEMHFGEKIKSSQEVSNKDKSNKHYEIPTIGI